MRTTRAWSGGRGGQAARITRIQLEDGARGGPPKQQRVLPAYSMPAREVGEPPNQEAKVGAPPEQRALLTEGM